MNLVQIDTKRIIDWATFHQVFAETFGVPEFYGGGLDSWVDCMSWLDDPEAGMTSIHAPIGGVIVLQLSNVDDFASRCPDQYEALIECAAFVNWRKIEMGEPAVLALSFFKTPRKAKPHSW